MYRQSLKVHHQLLTIITLERNMKKLKILFAQLTSTWHESAPTKRASCQGQSPGEGMCLNYFSETINDSWSIAKAINDSCQRKSPKTKASIDASKHSAELIWWSRIGH